MSDKLLLIKTRIRRCRECVYYSEPPRSYGAPAAPVDSLTCAGSVKTGNAVLWFRPPGAVGEAAYPPVSLPIPAWCPLPDFVEVREP